MTIGYPVKKSLSPLMHNAGYKELKIDGDYVFLACNVKPGQIEDCLKGIRSLGIHFVSVTMPHKQSVMSFLDVIDETAKKIGAVNSIINKDGKLIGYNTDWLGVVNVLEKVTSLTGKKAVVLGAGGAARATVFGLTKKGAKVTIINRTVETAKKLAEEFDSDYLALSEIEKVTNMNIIVNTSSVGMYPNENETLIPKKLINKNQIVLDAVYRPYETLLLNNAKQNGAKIIHGIEMLLQQGMAQFKMYTGQDAPEDAMRNALTNNLNQK